MAGLSFSVVINTYNRAQSLAVTLDSLRRLQHPAFEVVVVNGPSTDANNRCIGREATGLRDAKPVSGCAGCPPGASL